MRWAIVLLIIFSSVFIFLQSKTLNQYSEGYSDFTIVQALDQSSDYMTGFSFSEVFGVEELEGDNNNATAAQSTVKKEVPTGATDTPPPMDQWLIDPNFFPLGDPMLIPKLINKIYFQKGSGFPPKSSISPELTAAHKSWEVMNPGYRIRYFELDQARKYLHQHFHPVFLRAFDCLPAFASKSDLFRMTLLYREGGWHSDWKLLCLEKYILKNITDYTDIWAGYDMIDSVDVTPHRCVQNAFVGSRPRHPIIAKTLELLLKNIQSQHYSKWALDATATCLFGLGVQSSENERQSEWFSKVAGKFINHPEYAGAWEWDGKAIAKHKCDNCGSTQDWGGTGNNYIELYKHRNFYCEDAASLFRTTENW